VRWYSVGRSQSLDSDMGSWGHGYFSSTESVESRKLRPRAAVEAEMTDGGANGRDEYGTCPLTEGDPRRWARGTLDASSAPGREHFAPYLEGLAKRVKARSQARRRSAVRSFVQKKRPTSDWPRWGPRLSNQKFVLPIQVM
jgi:hypothetical protein